MDEFVASFSGMQVVGICLLVIGALLIAKWAHDPLYANFKWIYMVTGKGGFPDDGKMRTWGAFFISTYGFLWLLWHAHMTEGYFLGYIAAWGAVGSYALKKRVDQAIASPRDETPPSFGDAR